MIDAAGPTEVGVLDDGRAVHRITLGRAPGVVLEALTLGASVHRLEVSGPGGVRRNVVLGHATIQDRLAGGAYLGATVGRYANRIAHGRFPLDGREVVVGVHDRGHSLHGGPDGFDRRVWEVVAHGPDEVTLRLVSPDGDQGFPGEVVATVRYVVAGDVVRVEMGATVDAPTVVNLTNHAYFNLDGEGAGTVDDHLLTVAADEYTPVDGGSIPVGDHAPVDGTPFDLRTPVRLGAVVRSGHPQVLGSGGIDHNFVVRGTGMRRHASLESPRSGIRLDLSSDQPGLQVYTGNFLAGSPASTSGVRYRQGDGIALEPQLYPDTPNRPAWPSAQVAPGDTYAATLQWAFSRSRRQA
ncbi:aldose epimerase family protein [Nocardioides sp. GY 10113]|uniref:aldose epimerase family protein n=1 Tax=Nocardioides sp. GY 10113 TaxID=2569761 RepID=UPI00197FC698|nr:aldose epimerase family protein [Nocardioides sp. GY 10113]